MTLEHDLRSPDVVDLCVRILDAGVAHIEPVELSGAEIRQVLEDRDRDPLAWRMLGVIDAAGGDLVSARKALVRSLELEPAQSETLRRSWWECPPPQGAQSKSR